MDFKQKSVESNVEPEMLNAWKLTQYQLRESCVWKVTSFMAPQKQTVQHITIISVGSYSWKQKSVLRINEL